MWKVKFEFWFRTLQSNKSDFRKFEFWFRTLQSNKSDFRNFIFMVSWDNLEIFNGSLEILRENSAKHKITQINIKYFRREFPPTGDCICNPAMWGLLGPVSECVQLFVNSWPLWSCTIPGFLHHSWFYAHQIESHNIFSTFFLILYHL